MTLSLLGRCVRTGMMGAAATTSSIGVGSRAPFARAGVGAVLTQHRTDPRLGPVVLDLMAAGFSASEALQGAVAATPHRDWRQIAVIDAQGRTAAFSGAQVRPERAEAFGPSSVAVANIVRSAAVPKAMIDAFECDPSLPLADRLLAGLSAGDKAGGEIRPLVSAALVIVHEQSFPYVDLRVDRDTSPIAALMSLWDAYRPEAESYVMRAIDPELAMPPVFEA